MGKFCLFSGIYWSTKWYTTQSAFARVLMSIYFWWPQHLTHEGIGFISFYIDRCSYFILQKAAVSITKVKIKRYKDGWYKINFESGIIKRSQMPTKWTEPIQLHMRIETEFTQIFGGIGNKLHIKFSVSPIKIET